MLQYGHKNNKTDDSNMLKRSLNKFQTLIQITLFDIISSSIETYLLNFDKSISKAVN